MRFSYLESIICAFSKDNLFSGTNAKILSISPAIMGSDAFHAHISVWTIFDNMVDKSLLKTASIIYLS